MAALADIQEKGMVPPVSPLSVELPVLSDEDEAFLHSLADEDEGPAPELPERPPPLPARPKSTEPPDAPKDALAAKKSKWSWLRRDSREAKRKATATDLMSAAEGLKVANATTAEPEPTPEEVQKEEEEMSDVLDQLNLAAVDNRVFSLSRESQELLHKFTLVLKDLIHGVPTAYGDLENLLTSQEVQLQKSYQRLPSWMQKLVEQLPSKMSKSVGPEVLAAAAEKRGINSKYANTAAKGAEKAGLKVRIPSLKELVGNSSALIGMLKAIMNFLKLRFPAFMGMSVLYSLALFVLLLALWYCHKRGRESRLEKERDAIEDEVRKLDDGAESSSRRDRAIEEAGREHTSRHH